MPPTAPGSDGRAATAGASVPSHQRQGSSRPLPATGGGGGPAHRAAFVGRSAELALLQANLDAARAGNGALCVLAGEAGIGKTRLAAEFSERAEQSGALVLWGRCWEGSGAPAYWPWTEILREYARRRGTDALAAEAGEGHRLLADLLPDLGPGTDPAKPGRGSPQQARFALFDAVVRFLRAAAARRPLVLVLDDLQDADEESLLLLAFLARSLRSLPVLIIVTHRDTGAAARWLPPVATVLAALLREGRHVRLRGLPPEDIAAFVADEAGQPPSSALVDAIHQTTEGNPFFVEELVRLLAGEGLLTAGGASLPVLPVPDSVRATLRRRLEPLPAPTVTLLQQAAVIGREFEVALLERLCDQPATELLETLDHAVAAGVLHAVPGHPGRYAFAHTLIRSTLYELLLPAQRAAMHRSVGLALEVHHAADVSSHLDQLADHFFSAAAHEPERGLRYSRLAAQRSAALLGYEQAVAHLVRALQIADTVGLGGELRGELLLELGEAQASSGDVVSARETFLLATELLRDLSPVLFARAALGCARQPSGPPGTVDRDLVELLRAAAGRLGSSDQRLRVQLLSRLARELHHAPGSEGRLAISAEAVASARSVGDPALLAHALHARLTAVWGLQPAADRLAAAQEMLALAREGADPGLVLEAHLWRLVANLGLGDSAALDTDLKAHQRIAEVSGRRAHLWANRVVLGMRCLLEGAVIEAEQHAGEALAAAGAEDAGGSPTPDEAQLAFALQRLAIVREHGYSPDVELQMRDLAERFPQVPIWPCAVAAICAVTGRPAAAHRQLAELDPAALPADRHRLPALAHLAEAAHALGDAQLAKVLAPLLGEHAGEVVVADRAVACGGAVDHWLGLLQACNGEVDAAQARLRAAIALHDGLGARLWSVRSRLALADVLIAQGAAAQARPLLAEALTALQVLGQGPQAETVIRRLEALDRQGAGRDASRRPVSLPRERRRSRSAAPPAAGAGNLRFDREGEYWTVGLGGEEVRVKDMKGMRYLEHLLARPHEDLHVLDLVATLHADDPAVVAAAGAADAGATLDTQAKRAYRHRLEELRVDIDEARQANDRGRVERLEQELEFVARELAAAVGLRGKDRREASPVERARVRITKRIRTAIRRIGEHHPALGQHLDRSVRTGTFCRYEPADDAGATRGT